MLSVSTPSELRGWVADRRTKGRTVGFVPTMGALHEGHLSLVRRAKEVADEAVVSIFVNPTQFGPNEDFTRYPRQEAADKDLLRSAGCDLVYLPGADVMYPQGFATAVSVAGLSEGLCGVFRPGHFQGVATVVAKLLLQALPDVAVFGEKDYQQLQVIKRMVADLDIPTRVVGAPTLREADGLAKSSRNAYLSPEERRIAPALHGLMSEAVERIQAGEAGGKACAAVAAGLLQKGFAKVDYVELRDGENLAPVDRPTRPARLLAAAWLGRTRLIDNLPA